MTTRIGAVTASATTLTPTTHAIGDLMVGFAQRANATPPTVPAGWKQLPVTLVRSGTPACSGVLAYKYATATNDGSGTWTNATELSIVIYRAAAGSTLIPGQVAAAIATGTTNSFPALSPVADGSGNSWVIAFTGASNIAQSLTTAPSGMTNVSSGSIVGSANSIGLQDTNGAVSSWSLQTAAFGASGQSVTATLELVSVAFGSGAAPVGIYQHVPFGANVWTRGQTGNAFKCPLPSASGTGNCIVIDITYDGGATISSVVGAVNGSFGAAIKTALGGTGNQDTARFVFPNITSGQEVITVTFGAAVRVFNAEITEIYGVSSTPVDGSSNLSLSPTTATGSFTPTTNNNANGGHLMLTYFVKSDQFPSLKTTSVFPGANQQLLSANIGWNSDNDSLPTAMVTAIQATNAAFVGSIVSVAETGDNWNGITTAFLLSPGSGTSPGTNLIRMVALHHFSGTHFPATGVYEIEVACQGNLRAIASTDPNLNALTVWDSEGNTYTSDGNGAQFWYCQNTTPNPNLHIYINGGGADNSLSWRFFDIANAATTGVFVSSNVSNQNVSGLTSFTASPSPAPTGVGLSIANIGLGQGPGQGVSSPSGAVSDLCTYTFETDSDGVENADLLAHFVNIVGGAQTWTFQITSVVSNSTSGGFITFAGGIGILVRNITEATTVADIKMKQLKMLRGENISILDVLTKIGGGGGVVNTKTITELSTIVDIQMKQLRMMRTEGFSLTDVLSRAATVRFRILNESFAVDPDGSSAIANLFMGDPITVLDQLSTQGQIRAKSILEAITIIDVLTGIHTGAGIVNSKTILESITITDSLSRAIQRARVLNEALATADLLTRSIVANRNIFDAISIIDLNTFVGTRSYIKTLFESFTVQDQLSNYLLKRIALLEAVAMIDVDVGIYVPYSASIVALTSPVILGSG